MYHLFTVRTDRLLELSLERAELDAPLRVFSGWTAFTIIACWVASIMSASLPDAYRSSGFDGKAFAVSLQ